MKKISIIIPIKNEVKSLNVLLNEIKEVFQLIYQIIKFKFNQKKFNYSFDSIDSINSSNFINFLNSKNFNLRIVPKIIKKMIKNNGLAIKGRTL